MIANSFFKLPRILALVLLLSAPPLFAQKLPDAPPVDPIVAPQTAEAEAPPVNPIAAPQTAEADAENRLSQTKTLSYQLAKGRTLFVQYVAPADAEQATLMVMPGVNRNLLVTDKSVKALVAQGFGIVTFAFSVQPLSVAILEKSEIPLFLSKKFSLQDFADEIEFLAEKIKIDYSIKNLVPISLSYSGAASPFLKNFPLIIDTVPMTSAAAANPDLEQYRKMLKSGELFNPIFGPGITRSMLDQAYRKQWTVQTDSIVAQFNLPVSRKSDMIEGYTVMSRASEGFDWNNFPLSKNTRRVFIVAGKEGASLLQHQLQTFAKLLETRQDALLILIMESGHIIPEDQPETYAETIKMILSNTPQSGVVVITPSTGKKIILNDEQAKKWISDIVNGLKK